MAMSRSFGARSVTSRPPTTMCPPDASSSPAIMRSSVDLPHPDGPTSTMNSPSSIRSDTSSTAVTPPSNTFVTPSSTISATVPPGSGGHALAAGEQDTGQLQAVVQDDEVGASAWTNHADVVAAEHACGHQGGGVHGLDERRTQVVQVAARAEHGQDAPREHAVLAPRQSVVDGDVDASQAVAAVADPRRRDRVRDEREPPGRGAADEQHGLRGEMHAVDDQLDDDVVAGERRPGDAGIPVAERAHGV